MCCGGRYRGRKVEHVLDGENGTCVGMKIEGLGK